jgi:hypothetical protein
MTAYGNNKAIITNMEYYFKNNTKWLSFLALILVSANVPLECLAEI